MSVTGNGLTISEKIECVVCGRLGFVQLDQVPGRMLHPYNPPCDLPGVPPPRVPTKDQQAREYIKLRTQYPPPAKARVGS